jgi:hypothetical protein
MKISDISSQLSGKRKTVNDLARFIKNRNDDNPNYTLLLGAGCSITSSVRSATELITEWRNEVCAELGCSDPDTEKQKEFLKNTQTDWYDPTKEYSCLFERKYDLQRQRRIFVEKEVSDATPSLGYAYLTALVNQTYFNTIFTTNFDDLINEAFYFYSDQRPIVCAHDSSIDSITVTSKRPKIIKLHGDYLFDDIKATTKETESLEHNMKLKFIEFAKDYGLVVAGYSGCDRSVMDILTALLKSETYFKHGVYWCLRKDSEIPEELKKLLWKDKVYFVEIDGFDELFAEIYSYNNTNADLPISTLSVTRKPSEMVANILKSKWLKSTNSPILQKAYDTLRKQHAKSNLVNLILNKDGDLDNQINDQDLISIIELQQLYESHKFIEVIDKGKSVLQKNLSDNGKIRVINLLISAYRAIDNKDEAIKLADQLTKEDKYNVNHYILKSEIQSKIEQKILTLSDASEFSPYSVSIISKIVEVKTVQKNRSFGAEKQNIIKEIKELINKSLLIDPSLDNPCWKDKFNILGELGSAEEVKKARNEIIDKVDSMNPTSLTAFTFKLSNMEVDKDVDNLKSILIEIDTQRQISTQTRSIRLLELEIKTLIRFNLSKELLTYINQALALPNIHEYEDLVVQIAIAKRQVLGDEAEAINLLTKSLQKDFDVDVFNLLFRSYIENNKVTDAEALYSKSEFNLSNYLKFECFRALMESKGLYTEALTELEKRKAIEYVEHNSHMYLLIKCEKYVQAKELGKSILEPINFSTEDAVLIVNYELARKRLNETPSEKRLIDVLSQHSKDEHLKSAVYAVLSKKQDMLDSIRKVLRKDKTFKYQLSTWPVFDQYRNDSDFTSLIQ